MPYSSTSRLVGLAFGWELIRLQGATPDSTDRSLAGWFTAGQITRDEYVALVR